MSTLLAIGQQLLHSKKFLFSMSDHEIVSIPTFRLLRLLGKKVILIVHDAIPHDFARSNHRLIKRLILRLLYRSASVLVVLSEAGRRRLMAEFQISARTIHVIPHKAFGFACQSEIPGERMLLAFGSIGRNKNLLMVIDALKLARASGLDVKLLVAGGYDRSNPYCLECVTAINGEPSTFINKTGFVDEAEIPELIKRTDASFLLTPISIRKAAWQNI